MKDSSCRFVGIDWSGAKSPVRSHAIALSQCEANSRSAPTLVNTKLSRTDVFNEISHWTQNGSQSFIGIDCNFGYASDVVTQQFSPSASYWDLWNKVNEINIHHANYFAGDFWIHPEYKEYFWGCSC